MNNATTSKSRTGYIITYVNHPILWTLKLHALVTISTDEAEYAALSIKGNPELQESLRTEGISQLSLLQFLLRYTHYHSIHLQEDTCIYFCDNKAQVRRSEWYYA
eukprot:7206105-Ditylum_brightwellii.AAC.1